jgi:hypothetical protein
MDPFAPAEGLALTIPQSPPAIASLPARTHHQSMRCLSGRVVRNEPPRSYADLGAFQSTVPVWAVIANSIRWLQGRFRTMLTALA